MDIILPILLINVLFIKPCKYFFLTLKCAYFISSGKKIRSASVFYRFNTWVKVKFYSKVIFKSCDLMLTGTISSRLLKDFKLTHLASGDLLRNQISAATQSGKQAEKYLVKGQLVPDELIVNLISDELKLVKGSWLLDGEFNFCCFHFMIGYKLLFIKNRFLRIINVCAKSSNIRELILYYCK